MSGIKKVKKAKKAKAPKRVKLPRSVIKNLSKRDMKKIAKKVSRTNKKKRKSRSRGINTALGVVAVILCMVSSVLDVIISKKEKERI